ncbi:MurR/RpiR family transcriptional regulator, partial [Megamonas funiformis]|uniref:MurR/RpiR family transcriptional regulator n=1 Tax=Megamonas funiformis TaxID=437897 RepID=UPI000FEFDF50
MTLEELVNSKLDKLNPTDLIVWRYIYAHKKECCYISIYDIADNCNVSRTTVLRFAKKLGLDGFSDLKMMLKMEISQAREKTSMDIAEATVNLCKNVGEEVAKQDFTRLNKLLHNAKRIFVYASGHVQKNVASEISRLFVNYNVLVYEIKGPDEIGIILKNITENDLFIIISLSGESKKVVDVAQKLYLQKIPIISLTKLKSNTLATLSTENIYVTP